MNVSNKGIYSLRPQKYLTSVNLTIKNYYSLRKGNKNTSAFALKCIFTYLSFKFIYCLVFEFVE